MSLYDLLPRYMALFDGLKTAYGTGKGEWIKRPATADDFLRHLEGKGPGIGIGPLRPDNTVKFAAIDLDEPDFDAAREMQEYIPGASYIERSRSGNAHVWVFFEDPCAAWIAMGILREATVSAGKQHVEVFPKNPDFAKVKLGNYINLPYHGPWRPVLNPQAGERDLGLGEFIEEAERTRNDPRAWKQRATWLQLSPPSDRDTSEFGTQKSLHICAEKIIGEADINPVVEGHRAAVFFALAKQIANCSAYDRDTALMLMRNVNEWAEPPAPDSEIRRILNNAYEKQYTSTGCDDPLFAPYAHPDCPIANPRR